jgi:plastocyanin
MELLNSQLLTHANGYLHVFRKPGAYEYRIHLLLHEFEAGEGRSRFMIEVGEAGKTGKGAQHNVRLFWDNERRSYHAEPEKLSIAANDYVMWHNESNLPGVPPFSLRGQAKGGELFDSRQMGLHDVFTHLFMSPGEYPYQVCGKAGGVVIVHDHRQLEVTAYDKQLGSAALVRINSGKPTPKHVEIYAGQTVVWAVETGENVVIQTPLPDASPGKRDPRQTSSADRT